ncbi:MAG: hypothetical protein K0S74_70 [Chlamydiales bacterium]|jgi:lipoprotein-releasing system permease protein|nr:hypothetical protein [Chlamydiales bacterium]
MFELSVALKYLIPRRRQLSVSLICLISTLIISLVVWLVLVFLSVTRGLEHSWIEKLVAMGSPVRLVPTSAYYESYYYQVDSLSDSSNYTHKSLREKKASPLKDPYQPEVDPELPFEWTSTNSKSWTNIVPDTFTVLEKLEGVKDLHITDYEGAVATLRLRLIRPQNPYTDEYLQSTISHFCYLTSYDSNNPYLNRMLSPITTDDYSHLLSALNDAITYTNSSLLEEAEPPICFSEGFKDLLEGIRITHLKTETAGWEIGRELLPQNYKFSAYAIMSGADILYINIPPNSKSALTEQKELIEAGYILQTGNLTFNSDKISFEFNDTTYPSQTIGKTIPICLAGDILLPATLVESSLEHAILPTDLQFKLNANIQGWTLNGIIPFCSMNIGQIEPLDKEQQNLRLPLQLMQKSATNGTSYEKFYSWLGEGILLPRAFREKGVQIFDRGQFIYQAPTPSGLQDQRIPIFVAGFYDPGIMPLSVILTGFSTASTIRSIQNSQESALSNGIHVWFEPYEKAKEVKNQIKDRLEAQGLTPYWKIETYEEFDFAKDVVHELSSQKNLFNLLAIIIILVACSNIVSMLILLVNSKKTEIAIMQSMGASRLQIGLIFGLCGTLIGVVSCSVGTAAAWITLRYLRPLIDFLSKIQGHELLNPLFYGDTLPNHLQSDVLALALIATLVLSILAGVIPAIKASLLRPTDILKQ